MPSRHIINVINLHFDLVMPHITLANVSNKISDRELRVVLQTQQLRMAVVLADFVLGLARQQSAPNK